MLVSNIKSDFTFGNFRYKERYGTITSIRSRLLPDKLVVMVTPDNLENQK